MILTLYPHRNLDPIAAGGRAVVPGMQQPDGFGKAIFFDELQQQRKKKELEEAQAKQQFEGFVKQTLEAQKTAWQQDIPQITGAVNKLSSEYARLRSQGVDPFNAAKHPEAFQQFYNQMYDIQSMLASSRQDKVFYDIAEKKAMEENYQNQENQQALEQFRKAGVGNRKNFQLKYNYNEPEFIKSTASVVKTNEITETKSLGGGKNEVVTTKLADPASLAEVAMSTMIRSTGPKPQGFKEGVAREVQGMSEKQMLENALFFIELQQGGMLSKDARKEVSAQLLANKEALVGNAALGRAAMKIASSIDEKRKSEFKNDPKWMAEMMFGAGSKDPKNITTFGIIAQNITNAWSKSANDPDAFLKQISEKNGHINHQSGSVVLRVPTDGKAMLLPGGSIQIGVTRSGDSAMPYGSFSQFEVVYGYFNPASNTIIPLTPEQVKTNYKGMPVQPYIRAKFNPATIEQYTGRLDAMGNPVVNSEWTRLMNQGIDPKALNQGLFQGHQNYMYFNPNEPADLNMLNSFVTGTTTAYAGQKATGGGAIGQTPPQQAVNPFPWEDE